VTASFPTKTCQLRFPLTSFGQLDSATSVRAHRVPMHRGCPGGLSTPPSVPRAQNETAPPHSLYHRGGVVSRPLKALSDRVRWALENGMPTLSTLCDREASPPMRATPQSGSKASKGLSYPFVCTRRPRPDCAGRGRLAWQHAKLGKGFDVANVSLTDTNRPHPKAPFVNSFACSMPGHPTGQGTPFTLAEP
jgi:hypothetical protein